ncbi:MAG: hypothetical protein KC925_00400 [Candidatus Doudnabacteria bacterium]|nr:hypothetical protein [Candidatus Doudnabacteria bacterium]
MAKAAEKPHAQLLLEQIGLSENEAELYRLMLNHTRVTVQELQALSPFPRTLLYHILNGLIQHGLVTTIKQPRRTIYIAESPERIYDLFSNKQQELAQNGERVKELVPELKNRYRLSQHRPGVRFFDGIDGYRTALEDMLRSHPSQISTYAHITRSARPGVRVRSDIRKQRINAGISERVLLANTPEAEAWLNKARPEDSTTQYRRVPTTNSAYLLDLQLFDGRLLYTRYEEREPVVLLVEDQQLFDMQQATFDLLWNTSPDR